MTHPSSSVSTGIGDPRAWLEDNALSVSRARLVSGNHVNDTEPIPRVILPWPSARGATTFVELQSDLRHDLKVLRP